MDLGLTGRTALVCASTSGLGLAIAQNLATEGAHVVLTGRRGDLAAKEAAALPNAVGVEADLNDPDAPERLVRTAEETFGPVDVLVLNGGGPPAGTASEQKVESISAAVDSLLLPQQRLLERVVPGMRERGWGRVIAVGSSGVIEPALDLALSNVGRAALAALLKSLASDVAQDGVTVNMVLPGRIATPRVAALDQGRAEKEGRPVAEVEAMFRGMIPVGRYGDPSEFGAVAAFLCSSQASYVTGSQVRVDGGFIRSL
ncbi:MAG: SDR family oxidoreductase [Actinomycetes bacterium]